MKKIIICHFLTISLTVLTLFCFGQNKKALRQYYYWINQAELAICDSDYYKASDCYEKAFSYHKPFGNDVNFAFRINCIYTNNEDRTCNCYHYLAQMGEPADWHIEDTLKYANIWEKLKIIEDTTKCLVNEKIKKILSEINESDQQVRRQYFDNDKALDSVYKHVDSCNLEKLKLLYKNYPIIDNYTAGTNPLNGVLMYHFSKTLSFDPQTLFLKEVKKGNISAMQYIKVEDQCLNTPQLSSLNDSQLTHYGTNSSFAFIIDTIGFIFQPENLKQINKNRKKLFVSETWENFAHKKNYVFKNDNSDFSIVTRTRISFPPQKAIEIISQLKNDIDKRIYKGTYFYVKQPSYFFK